MMRYCVPDAFDVARIYYSYRELNQIVEADVLGRQILVRQFFKYCFECLTQFNFSHRNCIAIVNVIKTNPADI